MKSSNIKLALCKYISYRPLFEIAISVVLLSDEVPISPILLPFRVILLFTEILHGVSYTDQMHGEKENIAALHASHDSGDRRVSEEKTSPPSLRCSETG